MNRLALQTSTLAAALMVGGLLLPGAARAQEGTPPARLITMSGTGQAQAVPDEARLSAGVVSEGTTAAAALADNTAKMTAVFAAIRKLGVPDKSVQTSGFSVSPQYSPSDSGRARHITGYQVSNTVTVSLDDLTKLGPALDALVRSGANRIAGVAFSLRNPAPLLARAREDAVKDATRKAQTYARAAGVTLGPIQSIKESSNTFPRPRMQGLALAAGAPPPIAAGEQAVTATVTMSWQLR